MKTVQTTKRELTGFMVSTEKRIQVLNHKYNYNTDNMHLNVRNQYNSMLVAWDNAKSLRNQF